MKYIILFLTLVFSADGYTDGYSKQVNQYLSVDSLSQLQAHRVPVKNGQMEYYQFGSGTPIILIPGYATDVSSWDRELLIALANHHELFVINNRNVGGSVINSSRYESQDLANDIYQLITDLKLKQPAILGISMGGMIAQELAVLHQAELGSLILINTAIAGNQVVRPSPAVEKQMFSLPTNILKRFVIDIQLLFPPSWRLRMAYDLAVDRFQPQDYQEINLTAIKTKQQALVMHWIHDNATAKKISKLNLPVLILNGKADVVIPPINSVILARNIPHAELVRWEQGGHAMIYQFPQQIAAEVNQFIAKN